MQNTVDKNMSDFKFKINYLIQYHDKSRDESIQIACECLEDLQDIKQYCYDLLKYGFIDNFMISWNVENEMHIFRTYVNYTLKDGTINHDWYYGDYKDENYTL